MKSKSQHGVSFVSASRPLTIRTDKIGDYIQFRQHKLYLEDILRLDSYWCSQPVVRLVTGEILSGLVSDLYYHEDLYAEIVYVDSDIKVRIWERRYWE